MTSDSHQDLATTNSPSLAPSPSSRNEWIPSIVGGLLLASLLGFNLLLNSVTKPTSRTAALSTADPKTDLHAALVAAAEKGNAAAQLELAECYRSGPEGSLVEAVKWYTRAADAGNAQAKYRLSMFFQSGVVVEEDQDKCRELLAEAAADSHAGACLELARLHRAEGGEAAWNDEARAWLELAAQLGDTEANLTLARALLSGDGMRTDEPRAAAALRRAADAGNTEACRLLAECFQKGSGVDEDAAEAARWYGKAAARGDAEADYQYGMCLLNGEGVSRVPEAAVKFLELAATLDHVAATRRLAACYAEGEGVAEDDARSNSLYFDAASRGDLEAQRELGIRYLKGIGIQRNHREAVSWLRKGANNGDVLSQAVLAECLFEGIGTERDDTEAVTWAKKAADSGNATAQGLYGRALQGGNGIGKNPTEAVRYFRLAADQGHAWGQRLLSLAYSEGNGVSLNAKEAFKWIKLSADQGDSISQCILADAYADGKGAPKNVTEALRLLVPLAEEGDAVAQFKLGYRYYRGAGLAKDYAIAKKWLLRAAKQGNTFFHAEAQFVLAYMYRNGEGAPKNLKQAYYWASLGAANSTDHPSRTLLDELETRMTAEDIADAQRMAAAFEPAPEKAEASRGPEERTPTASSVASGSGFFITADGYFVTNNHVVEDGKRIRIMTANGDYPATVIRTDPNNDLAILKAEGRFTPLHVRGSRSLRASDRVATVGYPSPDVQGLSAKYTSGEVSSLSGMNDDARLLQVSVPLQPGNSGGPLVDSSGSVVGVIVSQWSKMHAIARQGIIPENVNYAIKGTILLGILEAVPDVAKGLVAKPADSSESSADMVARVTAATGMIIVTK
jgi:TPR repeat protein